MQGTTIGNLTGSGLDNNVETSKLLSKILNIYYTSGIDRIKTYGKRPSGNIVGEFVADGTTFQYILNVNNNSVYYKPVGVKSANKADSLLAEQENANRFKIIYSAREAFEVSDAEVIEQKLDSWFSRADAPTKAKVGVKTKVNKSGKTLTCTPDKTFPCGAVCRAMGKPCKQPMSPEVQEIAKQVAAKIKTPTVATSSTAKPVTETTAPTIGTTGKISAQKLAEQIAMEKSLEPDASKKFTDSPRLLPRTVLIKSIAMPDDEFDSNDLRAAAESFLELGGFIEPAILRRTGTPMNITYEIVSGKFQVAAAIVAKAIDAKRGEAMPAMVIEEENEAAFTKQMKAQKNANKNN
jgi:hypothetical protein